MRVLKDDTPIQVDQSLEIPTIPLVLGKVLGVLNNTATSACALEEVILHDPALSARILKLSNSAFYSFRTEVKTVSHAIVLLGLGLVRSLAIGVSVFESFAKGMKSEAKLIHQLWMHSFGVGLLAQEIWTPRSDKKEGEFAFLCGLLHDLGKVVYFKKDPVQYSPLFAVEKSASDQDLLSYEVDFYGMDHAAVGSSLARRWGLPQDLALVLQKHHDPNCSGVPLVAAVAMADYLVKQANIGWDGEMLLNIDLAAAQALLRMPPDEFERLSAIAAAKRSEIDDFFRLSA